MNPTQIDYEYYEWLTSQVHIPNGKKYDELFGILHTIEFRWTVPNDNNRITDALDLRVRFLNDEGYYDRELTLDGATILEILISLSRRVEFTAGGNSHKWAWKLLKNLRLTQMSDPLTDDDTLIIQDIIDALIWRTYKPNGKGGFFPLNRPEEDQRNVEIWYQMNAYVIERTSH